MLRRSAATISSLISTNNAPTSRMTDSPFVKIRTASVRRLSSRDVRTTEILLGQIMGQCTGGVVALLLHPADNDSTHLGER